MKMILSLFCAAFSIAVSFSQNGNPQDYLSAEFHRERREAFRTKMPANSVAVFFANPERNRANDVDYVYHQDPNFYYLTGYKEPNAVLVIFSDNQSKDGGQAYDEILYVQEKNAQREQWTGMRLGIEGAQKTLGFKMALNGRDFKNSGIEYAQFDKVLFNNFENDYRDSKRDEADLYSLINDFKKQSEYDKMPQPNAIKDRIYDMIKGSEPETIVNVVQNIERAMVYYPDLKEDKVITDFISAKDDNLRKELKQHVLNLEAEQKTNLDISTLPTIMAGLREIKSAEEMVLLKKAVRISAMGQLEVMKAMHPGMSESEVQGIHEYVYKKYGSEYEGYPSIVGAGHNGCVLHYIENSKTSLGDDLVLMDLGAEYHGYTADVTRTIPANGKFTKEQKEIYDLVYEAQEAGIKASVVGASFGAPDAAARQVINKGLVKLGIVKNEKDARIYFPHGTSHHIGLDVHDTSMQGDFKENMVITVEPGIYIQDNSDCDKKWWGIAVRIEDDILITSNGPINLSAEAPRKSSEIEAVMKEKSALSDFTLPNLD